MKNVAKVLAAGICVFAVNIPAGFCQGDDYLTPRGAPGSEITRMKTLNQVEPRQVISSLPYSITNPGSYYLAASVKGVAASNGITISSDDVKLDLNGFAINGAPNSLNGIEVTPPVRHNITIRNGVVRGWDRYGIQATNAQDCTLESIKAYMNGYMGIAIGDNSLLTDCLAYGNGSKFVPAPPNMPEDDGMHVGVYSTVKDCKSRNNRGAGIYACTGSRINSCTASQNGANGVFAEDYCTVSDCTVAGNQRGGITLMSKCRVIGNTSCDNTNSMDHQGSGILVAGSNNRIENNNVAGNDFGINVLPTSSNNLVTCNSASGNAIGSYQMSQGDRMGQVVTPASGMFSNSNPWANFVF